MTLTEKLLRAYQQYGPMTDEEVSLNSPIRYTSVQQTRKTLIERKQVESKDENRKTTSGKLARVYGLR